jgi:hypothetical protein
MAPTHRLLPMKWPTKWPTVTKMARGETLLVLLSESLFPRLFLNVLCQLNTEKLKRKTHMPQEKVERCRYCPHPVDPSKGHIRGPNGPMHWGCYRDENGKHPFSKKADKLRKVWLDKATKTNSKARR